AWTSGVQLVEHAQTLEREVLVDLLDPARERRDRRREPTRRDDPRLRRELRQDPREQALHESDVAEDDPGAEAVRGVLADRGGGRRERDAKEPRRSSEQRLRRDLEPRGERSAQEVAFLGDDVEVRRRAEVDDDGGPAVPA